MNPKRPTASDLWGPQRKPQVQSALQNVATGNAVTVVAAPAAGFRIVVLGLTVTGGTAVGGPVSLKSGAGGTKIWENFLQIASPIEDNPPTKIGECAAATLLEFRNDSAATAYVNVRYVIEGVV